jgi:hypothetical protein
MSHIHSLIAVAHNLLSKPHTYSIPHPASGMRAGRCDREEQLKEVLPSLAVLQFLHPFLEVCYFRLELLDGVEHGIVDRGAV